MSNANHPQQDRPLPDYRHLFEKLGKDLRAASAPVSDDDPLMIAWKAFQATEEFKNAEKWAQVVDLRVAPGDLQVRYPNMQGSLWCLFMNGFVAGRALSHGKQGG